MRSFAFWSKLMGSVALLLGGFEALPESRLLFWALIFAAGAGVLWALHEKDQRKTMEGLGSLLDRAYELQHRAVTSEESFRTWGSHYERWLNDCVHHLEAKLSHVHALVFRELSDQPGNFEIREAFNPDHRNQLNTLRKYCANLKRLAIDLVRAND